MPGAHWLAGMWSAETLHVRQLSVRFPSLYSVEAICVCRHHPLNRLRLPNICIRCIFFNRVVAFAPHLLKRLGLSAIAYKKAIALSHRPFGLLLNEISGVC